MHTHINDVITIIKRFTNIAYFIDGIHFRMFGVFTIRENVIMNLCRTEYANMLHENSIHFSLKEHDISNIFFYFRIRQQIKHTNLIYRQIQHIHVKNQMKTNQKIKYYMTPSQIRHIHRNQIKRLRYRTFIV